MKTAIRATIAALAAVTPAIAAETAGYEGNGLLLNLFIGFGALIIAFQLIPGIMLFTAMIKGLFATAEKPALAVNETEDKAQ